MPTIDPNAMDSKEIDASLENHHIIIKYRSFFNVVWGTPIQGKEALCFVKGFPGLFVLTERRAIIIAQYLEKQGWFKPKKLMNFCFEGGLDHLIKHEITINATKRIFRGYLKFSPHGVLGEAILQFVKLDPRIGRSLQEYLDKMKILHPITDSGIVRFDIMPQIWLKDRLKNR